MLRHSALLVQLHAGWPEIDRHTAPVEQRMPHAPQFDVVLSDSGFPPQQRLAELPEYW